MLFDDILVEAGEFGPYQIIVYTLLGLVGIVAGYHALAVAFIAGRMDHWCYVPGLQNLTEAQQKAVSIPKVLNQDGAFVYSTCEVYTHNYSMYSYEDFLNWNQTSIANNTGITTCQAWNFGQSLYHSTIGSKWGLVCGWEYMNALTQTIYMAGFLTGCFIFGELSDRFGRHRILLLNFNLMVAFGMAAAYAPNYPLFCLWRYGLGCSTAGAFTTAFVVAMEIIGPGYRTLTGIFVQAWFGSGIMLLPLVAYFIRDHVHLQVALALPPLLFLSYYWLVPESPRWLVSKGRYEEAENIIRKIAKFNGKTLPSKLNLKENVHEPEVGVDTSKKASAFDLVRTPNMRKKSLNIFFNWFVNSLVYYGLSLGASNMGGGPYLNTFLTGAAEFPGYLLCILIINREALGRRWSLFLCLLIGGVGCIVCIPLQNNEAYQIGLITASMIGKAGVSASFAIIYVYSAEAFPTVIRNVGVGTGSVHARVGGLIAPQVALLGTVWYALPSMIYGSCSILAAGLSLLLPETLNQKLPETLAEGEQFGKKIPKTDAEHGLQVETLVKHGENSDSICT